MNYLFDSQEDAPALIATDLGESKAVLECFRTLLSRYLAGNELALEVGK
jgi:hypothetical protein